MKRRRPVGLPAVHVPIILWPLLLIALMGYAIWAVCMGAVKLVRAYQDRPTLTQPAAVRKSTAPRSAPSPRRTPTVRPPRLPAHRSSRLHTPVDPGDVLYERWKAGETKATGKPETHTVGGKKMTGRIVDIDDLATDEKRWEPFPEETSTKSSF